MKIFGQGIKDAAERFFHGMYVSAAGDPQYDTLPPGTVVDGEVLDPTTIGEALDPTTIIEATQNAFMTNPASAIFASVMIALLLVFAMVGLYHLYEQRNGSAMITKGIQT